MRPQFSKGLSFKPTNSWPQGAWESNGLSKPFSRQRVLLESLVFSNELGYRLLDPCAALADFSGDVDLAAAVDQDGVHKQQRFRMKPRNGAHAREFAL